MKKLLFSLSIILFSLSAFSQMRNDLSANKKADLVNFNSAQDSTAYVCMGDLSPFDSYVRVYNYIQASTATPDGENVLSATGMFGVGRYIKVPQPQANWTQTTTTAIDYIKNKPAAVKAPTPYSGSTNSSGNYTVTFGTAYSVAPNVQANIIGGSNTQTIKITSVSTTAFTVNVTNRNEVLGLLPTYSNVSAASVDVIVTEK